MIGKSSYDDINKRAKKEFVTNDDGFYTTAKSHAIFDSLYIPNDMGYVVDRVNAYYLGEDLEEVDAEVVTEDNPINPDTNAKEE